MATPGQRDRDGLNGASAFAMVATGYQVGRSMRLVIGVALIVLLVAVAAFATRPTEADFDRMLDGVVRERIANTDVGASDDAVGTIALVGCKLRPTDCVEILRQSLDVKITRNLFTTHVEFHGLKRQGTCTGAFRRFWCSADMIDG